MHILILMSLVEVTLRNGSTLIPFMASEIVTARKVWWKKYERWQ